MGNQCKKCFFRRPSPKIYPKGAQLTPEQARQAHHRVNFLSIDNSAGFVQENHFGFRQIVGKAKSGSCIGFRL